MTKNNLKYSICKTLLLCILQAAGIGVFARQAVSHSDSVQALETDSLTPGYLGNFELSDSLKNDSIRAAFIADSIATLNKQQLEQFEKAVAPGEMALLSADSVTVVPEAVVENPKVWIPDANRATWFAVIFPGGGQIYNRKYWKLPIIYGGFAGCAYALNWNSNMLKDYTEAYADLLSGDPNRTSWESYLRTGQSKEQLQAQLKRGRDYYRRYRDISIFAFIGVYLISIIDAYVDAELSNFDVGPDLSMKISPAIINSQPNNRRLNGSAVGMQLSFRF